MAIHNGKTTKRILIEAKMVGYKLGSFILTKKQGKTIHTSEHNRKKLEKQRRKITQKKLRKPSTIKKKSSKASKRKKKQ